ncbi:MAG: type II toxin-antitoxin system RelE/ParE family toxin [Pseudomonadales bacterium]|jgi:toxin ParE1/3/4|nr:type II toxin-antitoxin system RelE/ParE family toxin [Pseudomonadales bacterium]
MAEYRLSRRAVTDLEAIAGFTIGRFGIEQARRYRVQLKECFDSLAANQAMGRRAEQIARGLRRFEHGSHSIFYVRSDEGVLIVRVLHSRMDAARRF